MENDKRIIYLVTTGSYSDYRVEAAFTSKEKAESYKTGLYDDTNDIEEFQLDPDERPRIPDGQAGFTVWMGIDGRASVYRSSGGPGRFYPGNEWERPWEIVKKANGELVLHTNMIAKDETHAIKIANERRASLIATGNFRDGVTSDMFK